MDFLDPRKRQKHSTRLMIGYVLMAIAISLSVWLLHKVTSGYGYDRKTGEIIQNGLLFVDSDPGGAAIYIDDKVRASTTAVRLVMPAGSYKLTLKKEGYRTWERRITLNESSVARYVYPFLFPEEPQVESLKVYPRNPQLITQSPDRRWLLVQLPALVNGNVAFDEYDTTALDTPHSILSLPGLILTNYSQSESSFKEVEWSSDNKRVLLLHTYKGGDEFIIFNREVPAESINVNKVFDVKPTEVALRNKKIDQLYIFDRSSGDLQIADTRNSRVTGLLRRVLAFKSNGANLISYVTAQNAPEGKVTARIWDGDESYPFYSFAAGSTYLIDMAQFQGSWYYVAGSDKDARINVFRDPLNGLRDQSIKTATPSLSLNIKGAAKISFSTNARFIAAEAGQTFAVYDLETQDLFRYALETPLSSALQWMDGHRLIGASKGMVFVTDYDSIYQQKLIPTTSLVGGFFDPDYNNLLTTVNVSGDTGGVALQRVDMRAGADLPR